MPDDLTQYRDDLVDAWNLLEAEEVRAEIYELLMYNGQYFREEFGGMFDSDDDIECEINDMVKRIKNKQAIVFAKYVPQEFVDKLMRLLNLYVSLGGRDDVKGIDA